MTCIKFFVYRVFYLVITQGWELGLNKAVLCRAAVSSQLCVFLTNTTQINVADQIEIINTATISRRGQPLRCRVQIVPQTEDQKYHLNASRSTISFYFKFSSK